MRVDHTDLDGVLILTPKRFRDDRGWFSETWNQATLDDAGISVGFVQDNQSFSEQKYTLRGLHYQTTPHAQDKLVRCTRGAILDVAVDVRPGSTTFAKWFGVELTAENSKQLFVPKGFLHGFLTLMPDTEVIYKCSAYYAPECDRAIRFDDADIGIDWGAPHNQFFLSEKDAAAPVLKDAVEVKPDTPE